MVDFSNNMLSGDLSAIRSWGNYVEVIDLSSNKLTGTLPNETSQFLRLMSFKASNNLLTGELPLVLGTYPEINVIDLSHNQIYGTLPLTLFTTLRLMDLNLSGNSFTGNIPFPHAATSQSSGVPSLPTQNLSLVSLDLSNNSLSGLLPQNIGIMSQLRLLDIARNNISGQIPRQFGMLHGLQYIDLSDNHFEGNIPDIFPDGLMGFNISYNDLSGTVPDNLLKFPASSFHPGNNLLVLPLPPPSHVPSVTDKGKHGHRKKQAIVYVLVVGGITSFFLILVSILLYRKFSYKQNAMEQQTSSSNLFGLRKNVEPPISTALSQDHLLSSRSASLKPGTVDVSEVPKQTIEPDIQEPPPKDGQLIHATACSSPPKIKEKSSMSLIISSPPPNYPCSSENPSMLSVCSPDRLAGDLHLFDNMIQFRAEELSRAPAEIIGRSCHGTSYKATLASGHVLTVKRLRENIAKSKKEFSREAKKLGTVRHPHILSLRGYYWGPKEHERLIISDYINSTSLTAHLCGMSRYSLLVNCLY